MTRDLSRPNSYDEWSTLQEAVVGVADGYLCHHVEHSFKLFFLSNIEDEIRARGRSSSLIHLPTQILDELIEDIEGFVEALTSFGTVVHRPARLDSPRTVRSPFWESHQTPALNVRDQTIVLGDTIVETAPHVRARYFENDFLRPIFYRYLNAGGKWISMPRPALAAGTLDTQFFRDHNYAVDDCLGPDDAHGLDGLGYELVFDGAQCVRVGADVLVNVANANHELAFTWLAQVFSPRFRFHRMYQMADNHIDSIIMPLRPGLLLLRSPEYERFLPDSLRSWDKIFAPDVTDAQFPSYSEVGLQIASRFIDMNVLVLDESTVVVNALCPELARCLENRGFTVVPVRHRHRRLFGGGFHCFTLDCVRAGGYETYL